MSLTASKPRPAARRRFAQPSLALLACALAPLAGCITVDGSLKADGSGTVEVTYQVSRTSTETLEKRRFASPQVKLESFAMKRDGTAVAKLSFDDPAKMSTLEIFRGVSIKRERDGEEERLTITRTNPDAKEGKDQGQPGPKINLTLPGKVLEANRNAKVDANHVAWSFGLAGFLEEKTIVLTARYLVSPAEPMPSAEAPSKAPPTEAGDAQKPPAGK